MNVLYFTQSILEPQRSPWKVLRQMHKETVESLEKSNNPLDFQDDNIIFFYSSNSFASR